MCSGKNTENIGFNTFTSGAANRRKQKLSKNRDFDGDSINDYLSFNYTGGSHCCYKMILKLSSVKDTIKYPFEMDGGYGFGIVDGSQHDQFDSFRENCIVQISLCSSNSIEHFALK
ncbi:MAG: hypothetical protein JKY54_10460 [Flavobacteriales bacterium]|nr:hypothetical protein [Flavobacteriales bacterium]